MKKSFVLLLSILIAQSTFCQKEKDAKFIKEIYNTALTNSSSYQWLHDLSYGIGGRLSGSPQAAAAVEFMAQLMDTNGYDSIWLQEVMVPHWVRGDSEVVRIVNSKMGTVNLGGLALGNSIGTGNSGLRSKVIEVQNFEDLESLGDEKIRGKIVFFNRPMDPMQIRTFNAYGGAVDQRVYGASEAAKYGAKAVIVRSMTTKMDDIPHTGTLVYREGIPQVPAVAISTRDSELLSDLLEEEEVEVYMKTTSHFLEDKLSYNVIGEIKGSKYPDEIILTGGHLDSWDVGHGAHDDGAGCVHAIDAVHLLKQLNYKPQRTLRTVLFMNEENGLVGGLKYAEVSNAKNEFHLAAIESDAGGFSPRGFAFDAHEDVKIPFRKAVYQWQSLLEAYSLSLSYSGSGADIRPLISQKGLLIGLRPDSQRYFDYHHAKTDVFETVNKRELELGSAAIASLVYLIDKYGLN